NFAKNIRKFIVFNEQGEQLKSQKISKDCWVIDTSLTNSIVVEYSYYAFELNAGSTYVDDEQLYINPVNCSIYSLDRISEQVDVELFIPDNFEIACGLKFKNNKATAVDYHEWVDSPLIASAQLQHCEFDCEGVLFHLWFQGECKVDWDKVIRDFKGYTVKQIEAFGSFPVKEYHYLFQITPYKSYHGVEHQSSTVIAL